MNKSKSAKLVLLCICLAIYGLVVTVSLATAQCYEGTTPPKEDIEWLYGSEEQDTIYYRDTMFPRKGGTLKIIGLTVIEGDTLYIMEKMRYSYYYRRINKHKPKHR